MTNFVKIFFFISFINYIKNFLNEFIEMTRRCNVTDGEYYIRFELHIYVRMSRMYVRLESREKRSHLFRWYNLCTVETSVDP